MMKKYFLPLIFIFFVYSETGEVEFQDLIKIDSNHYEVNFVLENTALILSESSNDPFEILVTIKDSTVVNDFSSMQNYPIKSVEAYQDQNDVKIKISLYEAARWAKPQQIVENSNLRLFVPLFFGKDIKTMQREVIVAIDAGHGGRDPGAISSELNVIEKEGSFYGYPYKHAKNVIDPEYGKLIPTVGRDFVDPIAELGPHVAPLGIEFYDSNKFPYEYHNNLFIALHGSWNKYNGKSGYKVVMVRLDEDGNFISQEDFITGWLENENAWGRPVQPFVMSDGSMLISDDKYNVIYRVTYKN